jgi:hypothetical protein
LLLGSCQISFSIIMSYYRLLGAILAIGSWPAFSMATLPMRRGPSRVRAQAGFWGICLAMVGAAATAGAGNLSDLLGQKNLTPEELVRVVADFSFELNPRLQEPETFLQRQRGDCADFANLASLVLKRHGYTTKLVVVMMSQQTHVVCYVKEAAGFLDYNHRTDAHPVVPCDGSLEDIAGKVAGDFRSPWHMASAFRYRESSAVFLDSVFATAGRAAKNRVSRTRPAAPPASLAGPTVALGSPVASRTMIN